MPQQLSALLGVLHLFTRGSMISFLCHHMFFFSRTFLSFPSSFTFAMSSNSGSSESNLWRSERIRSAGYHPRTTWRLPEIVSVVYDIQGE